MKYKIVHGDCIDELKKLDADSIDSLVTDPPAFLLSGNGQDGFMGKEWDGIRHLWRHLWRNDIFVEFAKNTLSEMIVDPSMAGEKLAQENANINGHVNVLTESVRSARLNSKSIDALKKDFAQGVALIPHEVLDSLKELCPSPIKLSPRIGKENSNARFVIPNSIIGLMPSFARNSAFLKTKKPSSKEVKTQVTLMDALKIKGAIEVTIGTKSVNEFMRETTENADCADLSVVKIDEFSVTTLSHIEKAELTKWITLLLCAVFAIRKQTTIQQVLINNFFSMVFKECHRVLKPGAHGLVWALPRTSHWTGMALEDAGFEIRDSVHHLFGTGFPKSLNIGKAIDKAAGVERVKGKEKYFAKKTLGSMNDDGWQPKPVYEETPATPEAKQWDGWGTSLKPAHEVWWLIRKTCSEKTVAKNVLKHGTGGINVDACRVGTETITQHKRDFSNIHGNKYGPGVKQPVKGETSTTQGRFPSNLIVSGEARDVLDEQSGVLKSGKPGIRRKPHKTNAMSGVLGLTGETEAGPGDSGGASRFFYCAKASKAERNAGCEGMEERQHGSLGGGAIKSLKTSAGNARDCRNRNHHPTVKAQKLMRYLCKMITPSGGIVLDPFMGSGSTGVAAKSEGFDFIGIEQDKEYCKIAWNRINQNECQAT